MEEEMKYHVNRKVWQVIWDNIMGDSGFGWGGSDFSNDVFEFRVYHWDDTENDYHFHHKPSGFKIQWYKYPLRGACCNMEITESQLIDVLYDCLNSLEEDKSFRILHSIDEWWLPKEQRKYGFSIYE